MNKFAFQLLAFLLFAEINAFGQQISGDSIVVKVKAYEDSIALRWAPTNHVLWQRLNKYGYTIERYTIVRDSQVLKTKPRIILANNVKPYAPNYWKNIIDTNDYAAIAAQALFGESFEITTGKSSGIVQIVNRAKEQEMRFSYTLLASDLSFKIAKMAGLAFVDTSVVKSEKYLYRVYANLPDSTEVIYGFIFSGPGERYELPVLPKPQAEFEDRKVLLSWESVPYQHIYTGYFIERSEDSLNYMRINKLPYVNTYNKTPNERTVKIDSLPKNGVKYFYRIVGIDAFGMESAPSLPVSGIGVESLTERAMLTAGVLKEGGVKLRWEFPANSEKKIRGYSIGRSVQSNGPFKAITPNLLPPHSRTFIDPVPELTNYYQITTLGISGKVYRSYPILVQLQDSIPPKTPIGLKGSVDSTGIVKLTWQSNTEPDLLGYRVYRSNFKQSEYSRIGSAHLSGPIFYDTINITTLTKNIYYKIGAIDNRYNESDVTEYLTIVKPDVVKPVSPVFTSIYSEDEGIYLKWINSSSADVKNHLLYRAINKKNAWALIKNFELSSNSYIDKEVDTGKMYSYILIAIDSSTNESKPSIPVSSSYVVVERKNPVEEVNVEVNERENLIHLSWEYPDSDVQRFLIYRSENESAIALYASTADKPSLIDTKIKKNSKYIYRIQALFKDGSRSDFSDEILIKY